MAKYFTIDVATQHDVIYAYRGDEHQNTLEGQVPPDDQAIASIKRPANVNEDKLDDFLTNLFVPVALANRGQRVLIRVGNDGIVMAWVGAIPANRPAE